MMKQSVATTFLNYALRMDRRCHRLLYGQKPLVSTWTLKWMRAEDATTGFNCTIFIMPFDGFTIEDAIPVNAEAVERGLLLSLQSSTISITEKKQNSLHTSETFQKCSRHNTLGMKTVSYEHIDNDGLPFVGSVLDGGDIVVSRVTHIAPKDQINGQRYYDNSAVAQDKQAGEVVSVLLTTDLKGQRKAKVMTDKTCPLIKGDKVCSFSRSSHNTIAAHPRVLTVDLAFC
jgi:DNA-directed RNA polymerase II subunit RPB2